MLASSVSDRTAIDNAYNDVNSCGPNLSSDAAVFTRAASSRRAMLASLARCRAAPRCRLPLLSDLANAWHASIAADQGFATWANDAATQGCVANDTNNPGYQATITPDNEATQVQDRLRRPVEPDRHQLRPHHLPAAATVATRPPAPPPGAPAPPRTAPHRHEALGWESPSPGLRGVVRTRSGLSLLVEE